MKRLRSYGDDLDVVVGEKGVLKDWGGGRREQDPDRSDRSDRSERSERSSSSHHRRWKYDRVMEDDREPSRSLRKRIDHDSDGFCRRKSYDRYRDDRGVSISPSPRSSYGGGDRMMHRSESFSGSRRDFPKGFRSERGERSRLDESVSSWRRLCSSKDVVVDEDVSRSGGGDFGRGSRVHVSSPSVSKEVVKSSPPRSRGSSRSSEVKKSDGVQGESSSSEMEEGELEPEPEFNSQVKQVVEQDEVEVPLTTANSEVRKEFECNEEVKSVTVCSDETNRLSKGPFEVGVEGVSDGKKDASILETMKDKEETGELPECEANFADGTVGVKEAETLRNGSGKEESVAVNQKFVAFPDHRLEDSDREPKFKDVPVDKALSLEEGQIEKQCISLQVEVEDTNCIDSKELNTAENSREELTLNLIADNLNGKDKGKSLALSPSHGTNSVENGGCIERDFLVCRDNAMEGPSSRGFELFSSSISAKPEKTSNSGAGRDEKLKTEPLELSLGLPDVLLPLPSHDPKPAPSSPSRAMSVQSIPSTYRTTSDGFTGSMSFSGSQTFFHNPSCSLTQNSFENYEQSVGSHPIFQGIEQVSQINWPGQSFNDPKRKETSIHQRILSNGNGSHASQKPQSIMFSQAMQGHQQLRLSEGSTGVPVGLDRQSSLRRQLSGVQLKNYSETRSPTQSGSRETRSEFSKDKKQTSKETSGSLFRNNSQREMEQPVIGGTVFVERIIGMIVSEPVQVMALRIHELAEQSIAFVKDRVCEIIVNKDKRGQLHTFQEALQNRSDLTLEILLKSHRVQLEILVAFKTGLQDFIRKASSIASSDLAEIFLNLKCRNLACMSLLPVDECDCKVCAQKTGFCSSCMCLICSKFDTALNTCSWVGCDVCLHWCHTECGIRESYVRNGRSVSGAQEKTEMQFHCVACNHPSEMFGFVKEVFRTCGKDWKAEALSKELGYVKRIFSASNDMRGKQLHRVAEQMMARLQNNSNLPEVYKYIMRFFTESDLEFGNTSTSSLKEPPHKNLGEGSNGIARPSQETTWLTSVSTENASNRETAIAAPPRLDWEQMGGRSGNQDLRMNVVNKPVVDELESIVRIKQAEAKMFQARADDARREAEGLKRISVAKNEKIEEEYSSRITKLRLTETEERRKRKLEELQVLDREHREYSSMRKRMETDIRDLLLKMEATKQNFI